MKKWLKILIIILVVIIIFLAAVAAYGIHTYKQVKEVIALSQDQSIKQNLEALAKGDCSKLVTVDAQMSNIKTKLSKLCNNLAVKFGAKRGWIKAEQYAACKEINNPENPIDKVLDQIKAACANRTAMK
jgi:cell division protein YceG involved in septum cleavage